MQVFGSRVRKSIGMAPAVVTLFGLILFVPVAAQVLADDEPKKKDGEATSSKDKDLPPRTEPAGDFAPPGPPHEGPGGMPQSVPSDQRRDLRSGFGPEPAAGPGRPSNGRDTNRPGGPPDFQPRGGSRPDRPPMEPIDPEMTRLDKAEGDLVRRAVELLNKYRATAKEQQAPLREELRKLITQQFETRQQRRELELARFEAELKRLRESADLREKKKQEIVEKRLSDLLDKDAAAAHLK
jgi:hypothetical protein